MVNQGMRERLNAGPSCFTSGSYGSVHYITCALRPSLILLLLSCGLASAAASAEGSGPWYESSNGNAPLQRVRRHAADQRLAAIQALIMLRNWNQNEQYGHGEIDPDFAGRRRRSAMDDYRTYFDKSTFSNLKSNSDAQKLVDFLQRPPGVTTRRQGPSAIPLDTDEYEDKWKWNIPAIDPTSSKEDKIKIQRNKSSLRDLLRGLNTQ